MTAPALAPVWRGVEEVPAGWGPCVVTLGVFDGLHRGHARLVQRAVGTGRARGLPVVLVTFDPHPARVVGLQRDTAALTTVERRAELAGDLGVDAVCVLPFTPGFAQLSPVAFVERVLVGALWAAAEETRLAKARAFRGTRVRRLPPQPFVAKCSRSAAMPP